MKTAKRRFTRHFDPHAFDALRGSKQLVQLIRDACGKCFRSDKKTVDVQFRESNKIMFYIGHTAPLTLKFYENGRFVTPHTGKAYRDQREWFGQRITTEDIDQWIDQWHHFLLNVKTKASCWTKEGWVQNTLSLELGYRGHNKSIVSLDRESLIGYESQPIKDELSEKYQLRSQAFAQSLRQEYGWAQPPGFGDELDSILWDKENKSLLITEVKNGASSTGGIYYAPLQVSGYYHAWCAFIKEEPERLWEGLSLLVDQKKEIGLLPQDLDWPESIADVRIVPVIVVPETNPMGQTRPRFAQACTSAKAWCNKKGYPTMDNLRVYDWNAFGLKTIDVAAWAN